MSPSDTDTTRAPLTGTVADVCHDLVATRSEYGDEERLADLVEARCAALGVAHERIRHCVIARTGGDGDPRRARRPPRHGAQLARRRRAPHGASASSAAAPPT